MGFSLLTCGLRRICAWWLRDYPRRSDARPWMLLNLARARLGLGRAADAWDVSRYAIALPADGVTRCHRLLLAAPDALEDAAHARETLEEVESTIEGVEDRFLADLASAVIAYRESTAPPHARELELRNALRLLWIRFPGARQSNVCRGQYRAIVRRLGDELGWWWSRVTMGLGL